MALQITIAVVALLLLLIDRGRVRPPGTRSPLRAVAGSLVVPGVGQLYNGQPRKAAIFLALGILVVLLTTFSSFMFFFWGMVALLLARLALVVVATVDAGRTAGSIQAHVAKPYNRWYVYVGVILVISALSGAVDVGVKAFRTPSGGMQPAMLVGDYFMARKVSADTYVDHRGDILVFKYPGDGKTDYFKRAVAFAGQNVEISGSTLIVDGEVIRESWARYTGNQGLHFGPYTVPDGHLFVLGDDAANSSDSRHWGALPRENLVAVAQYVYFSWDPNASSVRGNRIGMSLRAD